MPAGVVRCANPNEVRRSLLTIRNDRCQACISFYEQVSSIEDEDGPITKFRLRCNLVPPQVSLNGVYRPHPPCSQADEKRANPAFPVGPYYIGGTGAHTWPSFTYTLGSLASGDILPLLLADGLHLSQTLIAQWQHEFRVEPTMSAALLTTLHIHRSTFQEKLGLTHLLAPLVDLVHDFLYLRLSVLQAQLLRR